MESSIKVERVDPDFALASFGDLYMVIWRKNTTMHGANALRRGCLGFSETRPSGIALLTIVEENAPMPPSDAREAIATFLRDASEKIKASAVVFEGEGFRAAAVRSVVVGLTMLARQKYPHKVFGGLVDATAWLERQLASADLARPFSASEVNEAVAEIRARISRRSQQR